MAFADARLCDTGTAPDIRLGTRVVSVPLISGMRMLDGASD